MIVHRQAHFKSRWGTLDQVGRRAHAADGVVGGRGGRGGGDEVQMRMRPMHVTLIGLLLIPGVRDAAAGGHALAGRRRDARSHRLRPGVTACGGRPAGPVVPWIRRQHAELPVQRTSTRRGPTRYVVYFQGLERRRGLLGWQVESGANGDRDLRARRRGAPVAAPRRNPHRRRSHLRDRLHPTGGCSPTCSGRSVPTCSPPMPPWRPVSAPRCDHGSPDQSCMWAVTRESSGPLRGSGSRDRSRHRRERR